MFTNINGKINYSVSGKVFNYAHTDKKKLFLFKKFFLLLPKMHYWIY